MKKKVDNRVRTLVENCIKTNHRSFFVIVGDRGRDQVVNLHYMLSKITTKKPSVLWCYKKELGFSSHRTKRMKDIRKKMQKGQHDANVDDPFEMFVSSTNIRYCFYRESQNVLGQTFGMCVLQDFEALTPNILCRAIETVEGGGVCVLLLKTMSSLRQLYSLAMDAHKNYRTENNLDVQPRFNERFILSLSDLKNCLVVDDELNILPLSTHASDIKPLDDVKNTSKAHASRELKDLIQAHEDDEILYPLLKEARTVCQARAIITLFKPFQAKQNKGTVAVTAARGRGKSASLGLAIAAAIAKGVANVAVVAPVPENVSTLFEFIQKGLEVLGYEHHTDFHIINQAADAGYQGGNKNGPRSDSQGAAGVRRPSKIEIYRNNKQVIEYFPPEVASSGRGKIAELLVVDEAASIPLPKLKQIIGDGLIWFASTIQGYEGTGRSLSLKLISDLKKQAVGNMKKDAKKQIVGSFSSNLSTFDEVQMEEPIRYSPGDDVETWLHKVLCLDATEAFPLSSSTGLPPPSKCQLYQIDRDALFSGHPMAEQFLRSLMALFVSSHYKNSPNDLQMLADAPAHRVFALLPPIDPKQTKLPDALVAIQVAVEGSITKDVAHRAMVKGLKPSGDLIPWTVAQAFADDDFATLSGVRVVRIATHPAMQRMGYGVEAMRQLTDLLLKADGGALGQLDERGEVRASDAPMTFSLKKTKKPASFDNKKKNRRAERANDASDNEDDFEDSDVEEEEDETILSEEQREKLANEVLAPRAETESIALLRPASTLKFPGPIDYLGVAFGLTAELLGFWKRMGFTPVYIRQMATETTGEHSSICIRPLRDNSADEGTDGEDQTFKASFMNGEVPLPKWLLAFNADFRMRVHSFLSGPLRNLPSILALSLIGHPDTTPACGFDASGRRLMPLDEKSLSLFINDVDILRLTKYAQQNADLSLVQDLIPTISQLYFSGRLNDSESKEKVSLIMTQAATLLGMGAMRKTIQDLCNELNSPVNQVLALFNKAIININNHLNKIKENAAANEIDNELIETKKRMLKAEEEFSAKSRSLSKGKDSSLGGSLPLKSFAEEQREAATLEYEGLASKTSGGIQLNPAFLKKYSLADVDDGELKKAASGKKQGNVTSVSIKRTLAGRGDDAEEKSEPKKKKSFDGPKKDFKKKH
eukprot:GDKJ01020956.1.p1 GENE.GDKJ01020956.1~~GDKJ01020956.1.p1  ORF type:complete len:1168 (+),score=400.73 GDKJ01020956.1:23-3505(+)